MFALLDLHPVFEFKGPVELFQPTLAGVKSAFYALSKKYHISENAIHFIHGNTVVNDEWIAKNIKAQYMECWDHQELLLKVVVANFRDEEAKFRRVTEWYKRTVLQLIEDDAEDVELGSFLEYRQKRSLDYLKVDLSNFAEEHRTHQNKLLVALMWKILTERGENDYFGVSFPFLKDLTILDISFGALKKNIQQGECQSRKGWDIKILNWVLPRLGYLPIFLSRSKNGESTIQETRMFASDMSTAGRTLYRIIYNREIDASTETFLRTVVLDSVLKEDRKAYEGSYEAGSWSSGIVIAGLQTPAFFLHIAYSLPMIMKHLTAKVAIIADEDDESISCYYGKSTKTELYGKIETVLKTISTQLNALTDRSKKLLEKESNDPAIVERSRKAAERINRQKLDILRNLASSAENITLLTEAEDDGETEGSLDDFENLKEGLAAKGFDKSLRDLANLYVCVTATSIPCLHNCYEMNYRIYVHIKEIPTDYHGYGVGHNIDWIQVGATDDVANINKDIRAKVAVLLHECAGGGLRQRQKTANYSREKVKKIKKVIVAHIKSVDKSDADERIVRNHREADQIRESEIREFFRNELYPKEPYFSKKRRLHAAIRKLFSARKQYRDRVSPFSRDRQPVEKIMTDAISDHNDPIYPHVNVLLAPKTCKQMGNMNTLCLESVREYGTQSIPIVGFVYNSHRHGNMYLNMAEGSPFCGINLENLCTAIKEQLGTKVARVGCSVLEGNLVKITFVLINSKIRSTHVYYDVANAIFTYCGIFKPFLLCVSGEMAGRQAVMKDSEHKYFLTHMLTSFNNKDTTSMIQKIGRLCSCDPYDEVPRKLYCDKDTWTSINKALVDYRRYMRFLSERKGMKITEMLESLDTEDESMVAFFKELMLNGNFHRPSYAKEMKTKVPELLTNDFKEVVENYQPPPYDMIPDYEHTLEPGYVYQSDEDNAMDIDEVLSNTDSNEMSEVDDQTVNEHNNTTVFPFNLHPRSQMAAVWYLLARHADSAFTARHIYEHLVEDGYFSLSQEKSQDYHFYTTAADEETYIRRVARAAVDLVRGGLASSEGVGGVAEYSFVGEVVPQALID